MTKFKLLFSFSFFRIRKENRKIIKKKRNEEVKKEGRKEGN